MEKQNFKSYIDIFLTLLIIPLIIVVVIGIIKVIINGPPSESRIPDFIDHTIFFSFLLIVYLFLFFHPIVQDRWGYRPLSNIKDINKTRFNKKALSWSLGMGGFMIIFSLIVIIIVSNDIWTRFLFSFFIFSGCEYIVFGVYYYNREKGTFDDGIKD